MAPVSPTRHPHVRCRSPSTGTLCALFPCFTTLAKGAKQEQREQSSVGSAPTYHRSVIDLRLVREHPDVVRASQRARGADESLVDALLEADEQRRQAVK